MTKKEERKKYRKEYYKKHKERELWLMKTWKKDHPEYVKKWEKEHPEDVKRYKEKWRKENLIYFRKYMNRQYRTDMEFRLNRVLASNIYKALKKNKRYKKWEDLVNYTLKDLIKHLESLFTPEMNWDNYGSYWEIDHLKPKSLFNYNSPNDVEFQKCWALENLQPLEINENRRKYNRLKER